MREHDAVAALIDRIVAGARIPSRAARDELRRELWTHFDEAATSPEALAEALRRFGPEALVTEQWRRLYRRAYAALYAVKIAAAFAASVIVALAIELAVNLRLAGAPDAWRLTPGFPYAAALSIALVLAAVSAWEIIRAPFVPARAAIAAAAYAAVCAIGPLVLGEAGRMFVSAALLVGLGLLCSRVHVVARLFLIAALFAAAEYGLHAFIRIAFPARHALVVGLVLTAIWTCTVAILTRVDHAFAARFDPVPPTI